MFAARHNELSSKRIVERGEDDYLRVTTNWRQMPYLGIRDARAQ